MKQAITYLLLILFVGFQAGDVVRLCAEWLCPKGREHACCPQTPPVNGGPRVKAEAGHCSPAGAAAPLLLDRALCCESSFDGAHSLFLTTERFANDAFRQFLLSSTQPRDRTVSPADPVSTHSLSLRFSEDSSPSGLYSPVLRI